MNLIMNSNKNKGLPDRLTFLLVCSGSPRLVFPAAQVPKLILLGQSQNAFSDIQMELKNE